MPVATHERAGSLLITPFRAGAGFKVSPGEDSLYMEAPAGEGQLALVVAKERKHLPCKFISGATVERGPEAEGQAGAKVVSIGGKRYVLSDSILFCGKKVLKKDVAAADAEAGDAKKQTLADLYSAFGSKRKMAMVKKAKAMKYGTHTEKNNVEAIKEKLNRAEEAEEPRPLEVIPKFNADARSPEEIYSPEDLFEADVLDLVQIDPRVLGGELRPYNNLSEFSAGLVSSVDRRLPEREQARRLKLILLVDFLVKFLGAHRTSNLEALSEHLDPPQRGLLEVIPKLYLGRFAANAKKTIVLTPIDRDKIIIRILILFLIARDYRFSMSQDASLLEKIPPAKLTAYLRTIGCAVKRKMRETTYSLQTLPKIKAGK